MTIAKPEPTSDNLLLKKELFSADDYAEAINKELTRIETFTAQLSELNRRDSYSTEGMAFLIGFSSEMIQKYAAIKWEKLRNAN